MGLEPTNLLTASQALYQLSYAPRVEVKLAVLGVLRLRRRRVPSPAVRARGGEWRARSLLKEVIGVAYPGGMARAYDVDAVEQKWQRALGRRGHLRGRQRRPPASQFYALCMYPYPSGAAHQGHVRNYTFGDLVVRYQTMQGKAVLSPVRLRLLRPAGRERRHQDRDPPPGLHRRPHRRAEGSLVRLGAVYDWRREVRSHDPAYMRWNQVIFLKLLEAGLAYRAKAPGQLVPGLPDGAGQRAGPGRRDLRALGRPRWSRRDLEQWFFRITAYADELLDDLDGLEWPERVKTMQRNWIGRSEGAEFDLAVDGHAPRPDAAGVHHPARHQLRHDLCRRGARAPAGRRAHHRRPARGGRGAAHARRRPRPRSSARPTGARPRSTSAGPSPAATSSTPSPASRCRSTWPTTSSWATAPGPSWPCRPRTSATGTSPQAYGLPIVRTVQPPEGWDETGARPTRATGEKINSGFLDGLDIADGQGPRHRLARGAGASASGRSTTACATGWSPASASGAARSRSSTAPSTASCRCPRTSCRCWRPTTSSSCPPGSRRWPPTRGSSTPPVRSAAGPARARDRHHGHLRRLVVVLPALLRPLERRPAVRPGRGTPLDAGRPVHRRHRARHLAPALRPLLHPGPDRRGPGARVWPASRSGGCSPRA